MDEYIILGVGKYIVNIEEILEAQYEASSSSYRIIGFIDSDVEKHFKTFFGYKVLGNYEWIALHNGKLNAVSFINPVARNELVSKVKNLDNVHFPNIIHPSAIISRKASIGEGNIFAQNTVIAPYATIGDFNHFNYAVVVGHHCQIGNFVTCNGLSHIAGSSIVQDMAFIGPGAVVIDHVTIGSKSKIGANAVVRNSIPPNAVAVGVPARIIK